MSTSTSWVRGTIAWDAHIAPSVSAGTEPRSLIPALTLGAIRAVEYSGILTMRTWFLIAMSITTLGEEVLAQSGGGAPTWRPVVMGKNGMVAAEHPLQAVAGLRVLQSGGNAIDAAVAVFYMTAVTEPSEAGLGGDGFLLDYIKAIDRVILINGS